MTSVDDEAGTASNGVEASFSEVAFAHWQMERARIERDGGVPDVVRDVFHQLLHSFERKHGQVIGAYWAATSATGAVLTVPPRTFLDRLLRAAPAPLLHVAIDWTSELDEESRGLVYRCQVLAIRAEQSLGGPTARVALQWALSAITLILSRAEVAAGRIRGDTASNEPSPELKRELTAEDGDDLSTGVARELRKIEAYLERAAAAASARNYIFGILLGVAAVVTGTIVVELIVGSVPFADDAAVAVVAGAVGAAVSVVQRTRGDGAGVPGEIGVSPVVALGAVRPLLGAVFGVATYFILATEFITIGGEAAPAFAAVAFAAGFLERTARVLMLSPGAFPEPTASKALEIVERLPDALEETVRSTLRGRPLANWTGWVSANVDRPFELNPRLDTALRLEVTFSADSPERGGRPIAIRDGVDEDPVLFDLHAESDSVLIRHGEERVSVPLDGTATARIPVTPPREPGPHRIWVHVLQRNRVVQIVETEVQGPQS